MSLNPSTLALLACPCCHGPLQHHQHTLWCAHDALAFTIQMGIPNLLPDSGTPMDKTAYQALLAQGAYG